MVNKWIIILNRNWYSLMLIVPVGTILFDHSDSKYFLRFFVYLQEGTKMVNASKSHIFFNGSNGSMAFDELDWFWQFHFISAYTLFCLTHILFGFHCWCAANGIRHLTFVQFTIRLCVICMIQRYRVVCTTYYVVYAQHFYLKLIASNRFT